MSYQLNLEAFQGPFDLLLYLIDKNEIDIYDIPIAQITQEYLQCVERMQVLDLDVASEFLVMAATLLSIKAKMLLPKPTPEEEECEELDPRTELVHDLLEYRRYKQIALVLNEFSEQHSLTYARPNEEQLYAQFFAQDNPLDGKVLIDLTKALQSVLNALESKENIHYIKKEEVSLDQMMKDLFCRIKANPKGIDFMELFLKSSSRMEAIVRFLALLEIIRLSAAKVQQPDTYGHIYVFPGNLKAYEKTL